MQGYILGATRVRDEDLLVKVLTERHFYTLYRFYGARHSVVHLGHKIDFCIESSARELGKLKEPLHLGFSWEAQAQTRYFWQQYLALLCAHLRDTGDVAEFYFAHLEEGARKLERGDGKREMLNLYAKLLDYEGRKNSLKTCLICEKSLENQREIVLGRSLVCAHEGCMSGAVFEKERIARWLDGAGEFLTSGDVDNLWRILTLGM